MSILFRFLQGIASAILNISAYSFASLIWSENVETVIAMLEAMSGIGLILGPISGSLIYTFLGFKLSFVILGLSLLPLAFLASFFLQRRLERHLIHKMQENRQQIERVVSATILGQSPVTFKRHDTMEIVIEDNSFSVSNLTMLRNRRFVFAMLCGTLALFTDT